VEASSLTNSSIVTGSPISPDGVLPSDKPNRGANHEERPARRCRKPAERPSVFPCLSSGAAYQSWSA